MLKINIMIKYQMESFCFQGYEVKHSKTRTCLCDMQNFIISRLVREGL